MVEIGPNLSIVIREVAAAAVVIILILALLWRKSR